MNPRILATAIVLVVALIAVPSFMYEECRIDVPNKHIAVLTHKVGKDLESGVILAPTNEYKGVQIEVLTEGRYYYNPYDWTWQVVPQVEIPEGKLGVRIRMYGEDLAAGELIAWKENQKGIVSEVLRPGRYPINACVAGSALDPRKLRRDHRTARSGDNSRRIQGTHHRSYCSDARRGRINCYRPKASEACKQRRWSRARII